MTSAIIYSDLKFTGTAAPTGARHRDSTLEDPTDDSDIMYENVIVPQPVREKRPPPAPPAPPAPAMGRGRQLMAGLRKCSLHLSLVFLLLCLVLSAAVIGLTVKYVQKSSDFQTLVTDHQTMSSSMTRSLRSGDDLLKSLRIDLATTKAELEKTRLELTKMEQNNRDLNSRLKSNEGLLESANKDQTATKNELERTRSDLEKASWSNTDLTNDLQECRDQQKSTAEERRNYLSKLEKCKQDICPKGWELFGKKCLWFSEGEETWKDSKADCESKDSNLIIVQSSDWKLKTFIEEKQGTFWLGMEWNEKRKKWDWPKYYPENSKYWTGYRISDGRVQSFSSYYSYTNRWICEMNILLTTADTVCHRSDSA